MSDTFVQDESIETIIQRYKSTVYGVALSYTNNRSDADDIFQEVFLIYFKVKPQFNDEEHRKAWLIRTTINCSLSVVDSTYRKRTVPMDEMEEGSFQFESKEENAVYLALRELPEKYRTVLQLFYFEDMSIERISHVLNIKPGTVKVQLMRGRELMKTKLREVRAMMTDDIIRSMKDQMVPSDDVVSDLLAKISALEASSPDTTADDSSILSFDSARFDSEIESAAPAEISASRSSAKAKKHTTKSIWFYSTVAAASIILLVSSVALFNDSTNPGDLATNLVPNIVTSDEDTNLPVTDDSNPTETDNSAGDKKDSKAESFLQKLFGKDDKQESDSDKTDSDAVTENNDKENSGNSNSTDTKKPAVTDNTGNNGNHTSDSNSIQAIIKTIM